MYSNKNLKQASTESITISVLIKLMEVPNYHDFRYITFNVDEIKYFITSYTIVLL